LQEVAVQSAAFLLDFQAIDKPSGAGPAGKL